MEPVFFFYLQSLIIIKVAKPTRSSFSIVTATILTFFCIYLNNNRRMTVISLTEYHRIAKVLASRMIQQVIDIKLACKKSSRQSRIFFNAQFCLNITCDYIKAIIVILNMTSSQ